jgi:hypothetical protein
LEIRCSRNKQRAVADARQAGAEATVVAHLRRFLADFLFDLLPLDAEGWIRKHVVEVLAVQAVGGQGVAEDDVGHVLTLDQHVGLADGVGLGIQFLAVHDQPGAGIQAAEMFVGHAQHATGAGGGIVDRAHDAGPGECLVVFDEEQIDHQPNDFSRREMLAGGLVGQLGKLADQFLEDRAHLGVADHLGVQVDIGELFGDEIEQPGLGQLVDLGVKVEALEDVPHCRRECLHVGSQVLADVVLVAHQLLEVERRRVVEELAGLAQQEGFRVQPGCLAGLLLGKDSDLGRFQHAVEAPQHGEGQNDLAILRLLVVAAQKISDRPDEG